MGGFPSDIDGALPGVTLAKAHRLDWFGAIRVEGHPCHWLVETQQRQVSIVLSLGWCGAQVRQGKEHLPHIGERRPLSMPLLHPALRGLHRGIGCIGHAYLHFADIMEVEGEEVAVAQIIWRAWHQLVELVTLYNQDALLTLALGIDPVVQRADVVDG